MIVDDEASVRFSLESVFKRQYRVVAAESAEEALELLRRESPDLQSWTCSCRECPDSISYPC